MGTFCLSADCQGQESTRTLQPGFTDGVDDYDDGEPSSKKEDTAKDERMFRIADYDE